MKPFTAEQLRTILGGTPLTLLPATTEITNIVHDTRQVTTGSLFVALRGDNHDAHKFLPELTKLGAVAALVEEAPKDPVGNLAMLQVPSTRAALVKLGIHFRKQLTGKVICVGGSNGKTTTKNLIDTVLRYSPPGSTSGLHGQISPKSFNNDIGVPLTIFNANPKDDYLVLEVGTNHHGELKPLSDMAQPDIAVITSISEEHIAGLNDLDGVRREEASIISGLKPDGLLVYNGDDALLVQYLAPYAGKKISFGLNPTNDLFATDVRQDLNGIRFNLNANPRQEVYVPLLGNHSATNALAAIAVGRRMGLDQEQLIAALATAQPVPMRLEPQKFGGLTILNDAYNANPASMRAALLALVDLPAKNQKIAVLGDMLELGDDAESYHREMARFCAPLPIDAFICVGTHAGHLMNELIALRIPAERLKHFPTSTEAANQLPGLLTDGDLVLLKGSRSMNLEKIASALTNRDDPRIRAAI